MKRHRIVLLCLMFLLAVLSGCGASGTPDSQSAVQETGTEISADEVIADIQTIGIVDTDGAKAAAVVVKYTVDLTGASPDVSDYAVTDYASDAGDKACELGSNPGTPVRVYVNDAPSISETGGSGFGNYVVIELNTDYQFGSVASSYREAMWAEVRQTGTLQTDNAVITSGENSVVNYTEVSAGRDTRKEAETGKYSFPALDAFELHTLDGSAGYEAFHASGCFEEATGELVDVDLPYALYVPEDYDGNQEYGLVLQIHDAGFMGDDPMITLTEAQGCVNFASSDVQEIAKAQGLGGLIVVAPQISMELRSTRDNWSTSAAVPATWQLLDSLTDTYNVSMEHIYATGQSMGGMQVVAMAAQRDNYFAGVWANGCQWGTNYNLSDTGYDGEAYYAAPADGAIIWTQDADGNPVDYRNWYYLLSDDNLLITNCTGDTYSSGVWQETAYLLSDLAGVEIPKAAWNPLTTDREEQNRILTELVSQPSERGFYWDAFDGGNHMATWIYSHGVRAHYEWLLTQSRNAEQRREKLALNAPFVWADEQIRTDERILGQDEAGNDVYYATGEAGSGTADYNSALLGRGGSYVVNAPGWTPEE